MATKYFRNDLALMIDLTMFKRVRDQNQSNIQLLERGSIKKVPKGFTVGQSEVP